MRPRACACHVRRPVRLDLDHLGDKVCQDAGRLRSSHGDTEVDDTQAVECAGCGHIAAHSTAQGREGDACQMEGQPRLRLPLLSLHGALRYLSTSGLTSGSLARALPCTSTCSSPGSIAVPQTQVNACFLGTELSVITWM